MSIPKLKVGQVWQCYTQGYRAVIRQVLETRVAAYLTYSAHHNQIVPYGTYEYSLTAIKMLDGISLCYPNISDTANPEWGGNLRSLIYDPTET